MNEKITINRNAELITATQSGERLIEYCGFQLWIDQDVFPPDLGLASTGLVEILKNQKVNSALDVGTGSLLLALTLKKSGIPEVWATDIHLPAIQCAKKNLELNSRVGQIHILQSDLLMNVPKSKMFDLIVFNQPFYPIHGKPIAGMGHDGGFEISSRFLTQAKNHLSKDGQILMPYFQPLAGIEHNPATAAESLGYSTEIVHRYEDQSEGLIYRFKIPSTKA